MVTVNPLNIGDVEGYDGGAEIPAVMAGDKTLVGVRKSGDGTVWTISNELGWLFLRLLTNGTISTDAVNLGSGEAIDITDKIGGKAISTDDLGRFLAAGMRFARDSIGGWRVGDQLGQIGGAYSRPDGGAGVLDMVFGRDEQRGYRIGDKLGQHGGPVTLPDGSVQIGDMVIRRDPDGKMNVGDRLGGALVRQTRFGPLVMGQRMGPRDFYLPAGPLMTQWRYARAGVLQGLRTGRVLIVGDSNILGTASGGPGQSRREYSVPTLLAKMLNRSLGAASYSTFWGGGGWPDTSYYTNNYWPAMTAGAGWSFSTERSAGEMWQNSTTTEAITIAPNAGRTWDTAEIYVAIDSAVTVRISNGAESQDYTPATGAIAKIKRTFANNSSPLAISRQDGGNLRVIGGGVYNDAAREMVVLNMSRGGWRTDNWCDDSAYYSALNALKAVQGDFAIVSLMINDQTVDRPIVDFMSNYQKIIDGLASVGCGVGLMVSMVPDRTNVIAWEDYVDAVYELGRLNGLPVIDTTARLGSAIEITNAGMRSDSAHLNGYGYGDQAVALHQLLTNFC